MLQAAAAERELDPDKSRRVTFYFEDIGPLFLSPRHEREWRLKRNLEVNLSTEKEKEAELKYSQRYGPVARRDPYTGKVSFETVDRNRASARDHYQFLLGHQNTVKTHTL